MPSLFLTLSLALTPPPVVTVDRDNTVIRESCIVDIATHPIADTDGNGVIQIHGEGIHVDFNHERLHGVPDDRTPDLYTGVGVRISGRNIEVSNLSVSGFEVGIHAMDADRLIIHDCDVSDNFRQRLRSTPTREDSRDWLRPHENDNNEWITNYGAGLCIEDSNYVTLRGIRARNIQNGIVLDRVNESEIFDCDCSFLSGWGLAMWRCNDNIISRNAFDFCIRGYSHGVYNRGQDSAGVLVFEQCTENLFFDNSVTHGGDGFFCFSGSEALGERDPDGQHADPEWYRDRGNRKNMFIGNDCSDAAAHGIELTFGFDNHIYENRIEGNAICGIWGGYSQRTQIAGNTISNNGDMGYGLERGGVNIEHGNDNWIHANLFSKNKCAIHFWWDNDESLLKLPWARVNRTSTDRNVIYGNTFHNDDLAIHLRRTGNTYVLRNKYDDVGMEIDGDEQSRANIKRELGNTPLVWNKPDYEPIGDSRPVGARDHLRGRVNIIMTEWGPWDHETPLLRLISAGSSSRDHRWQLLKAPPITGVRFIHPFTRDQWESEMGGIEWGLHKNCEQGITVSAPPDNGVYPYRVAFKAGIEEYEASGVIVNTIWSVRAFPWTADPRHDPEQWRKDADGNQVVKFDVRSLDLPYGHGGPSDLDLGLKDIGLPRDRFGTIATTTLRFPSGKWNIRTSSDDGIRVMVDDDLVIDDWTWHPPKEHLYTLEVDEPRTITLRVEHFELDGHAELSLEIDEAGS